MDPPHVLAGATSPASVREAGPLVQRTAALVVSDPHIRHGIETGTAGASLTLAGPETVSFADVILTDATKDVDDVIAALRARARADAAVVYIFGGSAPECVSAAHAAGAFACIQFPFVGDELAGLIKSAVDATTAKLRIANLAKELDLQLHLASIGRMSAGLSHEIANPLAVAMGSLYFIRQEVARMTESERLLHVLSSAAHGEREQVCHVARMHLAASRGPSDLFSAMDDAQNSYQRIEALLTNLRVLIGQGNVKQHDVDLLDVVEDVRRWAAEPLHGVTVEVEGGSTWVRTDPSLLRQIVLNLATNAANAAKSLSAARVRFHVYSTIAGEAVLSVRDNGPGIADEMQEKIFEPFFTTRRGRGGTGLGLSLCRELARQIGAEISLWSAPGRGSCFRVSLPIGGPR